MGETMGNAGNKNEDEFRLCCVLCDNTANLTLTAHRNAMGFVVGWLVGCTICQPQLSEKRVKIEPLDDDVT